MSIKFPPVLPSPHQCRHNFVCVQRCGCLHMLALHVSSRDARVGDFALTCDQFTLANPPVPTVADNHPAASPRPPLLPVQAATPQSSPQSAIFGRSLSERPSVPPPLQGRFRPRLALSLAPDRRLLLQFAHAWTCCSSHFFSWAKRRVQDLGGCFGETRLTEVCFHEQVCIP